MPDLTQQQKDDLAKFAGGTNYHHVDDMYACQFYVPGNPSAPLDIHTWRFADGLEIPCADWSPATNLAQGWLVLEALIKKKGWWHFIEVCRKAIYKGNQPNVYNLDWLMPTVCATALEIIEQEGR